MVGSDFERKPKESDASYFARLDDALADAVGNRDAASFYALANILGRKPSSDVEVELYDEGAGAGGSGSGSQVFSMRIPVLRSPNRPSGPSRLEQSPSFEGEGLDDEPHNGIDYGQMGRAASSAYWRTRSKKTR